MSRPGSYSVGDYVWCCRCRRVECVGAVFHDEPYHGGNSRLATCAEVAEALAGNAPAKPSVDAVEGHGVHEHVYRCQDCGLVESDVLSDERLAANAPTSKSDEAS